MSTRSGYVAIVGAPNVGKSTLLNRILGSALSIATPKPQTTRERIAGVLNLPEAQVVLVDTPGVCEARNALDRHMAGQIRLALADVDLVVLVTEASAALERVPRPEEKLLLDTIGGDGKPLFLALNKIDLVRPKSRLLPLIERWNQCASPAQLIPISAHSGDGVAELVRAVIPLLPEGPRYFPDDVLTDRTERFLVAEKVREHVFLCAREEVPYASAVAIERFEERLARGDVVVEAAIYVERESQKRILVGKGGSMIRQIGMRARMGASELLGRPVHLKIEVRVAPGWRRDPTALERLGYGEWA